MHLLKISSYLLPLEERQLVLMMMLFLLMELTSVIFVGFLHLRAQMMIGVAIDLEKTSQII